VTTSSTRTGRASHLARVRSVLRKGFASSVGSLSQDGAERARHVRLLAKDSKPVCAPFTASASNCREKSFGFGVWCAHQLSAAVIAVSNASRNQRARGEVRVVRVCPSRALLVTTEGCRADTSRDSGPTQSHPSEQRRCLALVMCANSWRRRGDDDVIASCQPTRSAAGLARVKYTGLDVPHR